MPLNYEWLQMRGITCVIVSYKYGHLVSHALESVLWQTKKPERILVVDDGVGDCFFIGEKYPEIKLLEREKNLGIVENFNDILFNHVKTDRVLFLGGDNWLHPDTILLTSDMPDDIVSYDAYIVGEGRYVRWTLPTQPHGSALYNVKLAKEVGGYQPSGHAHSEEDSELFKKMMDAGATFARVDKPLLYYRHHRHNYNK